MNWLERYLKYTEDTESSTLFNKWVGISTVASALQKKTWLDVGRLKVYPNMYIVLVANPGVARKSQAITYASEIISAIGSIHVSADSVTPQALIQDIEESTKFTELPNGDILRHASLSVISKEFESFLGSAGNSNKMLVTLTDLFDAGEKPWQHRTKSSGTSLIPSVYLNILGATTPQSLRLSLSGIAIGGGLTSRIVFVFSKESQKKVPIPVWTQELQDMKDELIMGLTRISGISGSFTYTPAAEEYWIEWYLNYDSGNVKRIQPRWEFDGWYSRKPLMIQKLCVILSACGDSYRKITVSDIQEAIEYIEEVEKDMANIFPAELVQLKKENAKSACVLKYLKHYKEIAEKHLLQLVWRDMTEEEFDIAIVELVESGKCAVYNSKGGKETYYKYEESTNES